MELHGTGNGTAVTSKLLYANRAITRQLEAAKRPPPRAPILIMPDTPYKPADWCASCHKRFKTYTRRQLAQHYRHCKSVWEQYHPTNRQARKAVDDMILALDSAWLSYEASEALLQRAGRLPPPEPARRLPTSTVRL